MTSIPIHGDARTAPRRLSLSLSRVRPELVALLVLAAVLDLWALDRNGFANDYYAAAVRAMSTDWQAFLFGSFDASGVMTVDKPPLALWVQALSARAFGFNSWSLLVPQARRHGRRRRRLARPDGLDAGERPPLDLRHERQRHLVTDHGLQRPRTPRRPGRRHGRARRWRCRRRVRR